jgi:hypothetical protein
VSRDLRDLERRRLRSLVEVDLVTAEELHAPDFELVTPGGSIWSRERYLGGIASGDIDYRRFEVVSDIDVLADGDLAVLRYRSAIDISVTGGTPGPLAAQHLDVYVRDADGRWRVRWSQATEVVQPSLQGVPHGSDRGAGPPAVLRGAEGRRRGELRGGRSGRTERADDHAEDDRGAASTGLRLGQPAR